MERSEVVIVSVKPDVVVPALREIKDLPASKNKLFISVAMGVSTTTIEKVHFIFTVKYKLSDFFKLILNNNVTCHN